MKKQLLLAAALIAGGFSASAQIADGSAAPDFTATDINGNSHTLSTYLAQGKTVIIDISATWCGPCWAYHGTHALADLYNAYGPNGSDEVMVFFIEGDASTTTSEIYGNGSSTQGDWTQNSPYPIIDNASIASAYQIGYYPTIFRICPDGQGGGTVYEEGQSSFSQLVSSIGSNCGQTLTGVANHAGVEGGEASVCSTTGDASVDFKNYGNNAITSATVELKENGSTIATQNFSGNVAAFATGTVNFSGVNFTQGNTYTAEMTAVNGGAPANANTTTADVEVHIAELTGLAITVNFFTDNYPSETSWEILNSANQVVASGGPYQPGTDDQWGGGGPDAQTTKTSTHVLPAGVDCYSVRLTDAYGDGQQYGTGQNPDPNNEFGIQVMSNGAEVFNWDGGSGWATVSRGAAMKTDATSGAFELSLEDLKVYPNPANDVLNVEFNLDAEVMSVSILDLAGRVISTENGSNNVQFNVSDLASGSYLVRIATANGSYTESVVIK